MTKWHFWRLYWRLIFLHVRAQLEFPLDFWVGVLGSALKQLTALVFLGVLFAHIPAIDGWNRWEVAFLFALVLIPQGLADIVAAGPWSLRVLVSQGGFDRILLRPAPPLLLILAQFANFHQGVATIVLGAALLVITSGHLHMVWGVASVIVFLGALGSGTVIIGAINLAANSYVFWEPTPTSALPFLFNNLIEVAKFPLSAYNNAFIRVMLTYVIPFGVISYYPGRMLLGKSAISAGVVLLTPAMAVVVAAVAYGMWKAGLARYQSSGH